jgi:hypothetical protein
MEEIKVSPSRTCLLPQIAVLLCSPLRAIEELATSNHSKAPLLLLIHCLLFQTQLERNDSFASIPTVDFMKDLIDGELKEIDQMQITDFRRKENEGLMEPEPLLIADKSRFVLFPIKHTDVSL